MIYICYLGGARSEQRQQSLRRDTCEPRGSCFFFAAGCRRVAPARRFVTRFKQIHPPARRRRRPTDGIIIIIKARCAALPSRSLAPSAMKVPLGAKLNFKTVSSYIVRFASLQRLA